MIPGSGTEGLSPDSRSSAGGWRLTCTRIPWYTHSQKSSRAHRNTDWKRSSSIPGNQLFTRKDSGKKGSGRQRQKSPMEADSPAPSKGARPEPGPNSPRLSPPSEPKERWGTKQTKSQWTDCSSDHCGARSAPTSAAAPEQRLSGAGKGTRQQCWPRSQAPRLCLQPYQV